MFCGGQRGLGEPRPRLRPAQALSSSLGRSTAECEWSESSIPVSRVGALGFQNTLDFEDGLI